MLYLAEITYSEDTGHNTSIHNTIYRLVEPDVSISCYDKVVKWFQLEYYGKNYEIVNISLSRPIQ